jgi:hypothetical protein
MPNGVNIDMKHRKQQILATAFILLGSLGLQSSTGPSWLSLERKTAAQREANIFISLIWEGGHIDHENLRAIEAFRQKHPSYGFMHFISPAYFSKDPVSASSAEIKAHIKAKDRIGISMQSWKSLVQKSGVIFRSEPTFWGPTVRPSQCNPDCGHDVSLSSYQAKELDAIFATGLSLLAQQGFTSVQSLFVSGWQASGSVLESAAKHGIRYDFSAVNAEVLAPVIRDYPLYGWLQQSWQGQQINGQQLQLGAEYSIFEVGNSATTIDYLSSEDIVAQFQQQLKDTRPVFHIGIHQETAATYLPRLYEAIERMEALAEEYQISLVPSVLPQRLQTAALTL